MNKYKRQDLITLGFLGLCFAIITSIYIGNKNDSESNLSSEDSEYQINTNYYDCGNPFRLTVVKPNTESDSKWEHKEITSSEGNQEATIIKDTTSKFEIGEECEIPSVPTHVKFCTDYRSYDLWYTPHYRLQQVAWTDEYGMRRYNNDYLVALGSYYSTDIGDRFEVTLDTGKTFTVMMADGKWDIDCDENNMYTPTIDYNGEYAGNLLEFIMDKYSVSSEMYGYGSLDYYDAFKGSVIKMVYLGRDDSADWDTYY